MELDGNILHIDSLIAVTIGIIVLFVGKRLNDGIGFLREYSIPEPVTGGLLFSILFGLVYLVLNVEVEFNLAARDILLVYFFTTIGINSSVRDLISGGRPLTILLLIVTCLFAWILLTNLLPHGFLGKHGIKWPTRAPAMALIADVALGTFLAMSLMSMQLWTLVDLAGPVFTILALQLVLAVLVAIFILFPAMGRDYNAAVVCAGFSGVTLGATPTAMANMAAVTQRFGPSHQAFIIVPLVSAFFIDLANAVMIPFFLANF